MNVVTVYEAKRKLDSLIKKVFSDAEPTIIATDYGEQVEKVRLLVHGRAEPIKSVKMDVFAYA